MPVSSTAGPLTRTRMSGWWSAGSPATTSMTSTSKVVMSVPWMTVRPVHFMPLWTWESGMIGSAARAGAAAASDTRTAAAARRDAGGIGVGQAIYAWRMGAAIRFDGQRLEGLDQTLLPHEEGWPGRGAGGAAAGAVRRPAVRGARP